MNRLFFSSIAMLTATTVFGQNSVSINQSGGPGNVATVNQSGGGNTVSINQSNTQPSDSSKQGNRVSLRVPKGTQTAINQHNLGPNAVEISQEGQATATINQSSGTDENSVTVLPSPPSSTQRNRPAKRRNRRP